MGGLRLIMTMMFLDASLDTGSDEERVAMLVRLALINSHYWRGLCAHARDVCICTHGLSQESVIQIVSRAAEEIGCTMHVGVLTWQQGQISLLRLSQVEMSTIKSCVVAATPTSQIMSPIPLPGGIWISHVYDKRPFCGHINEF